MSEQQWKWTIAELQGEGRAQRWVRREEEFDTREEAEAWINAQPNPVAFESREIAEGTTEPAAQGEPADGAANGTA